MPYPPTIPPATRTNSTPQADNHPGDHNAISAAFSDLVNELGINPSGASLSVQARIDAQDAGITNALNAANGAVAVNGTQDGRLGAIEGALPSYRVSSRIGPSHYAANGDITFRANSTVVTTDANGRAAVSFAYPATSTGIAVLTNGDANAVMAILSFFAGHNNNGFFIQANHAAFGGAPVASSSVRVEYIDIIPGQSG